MTSKFDQAIQQWIADGFEFVGNGFLDVDDPPCCPSCGEGGFFFALWEHPSLAIDSGIVDDDGVSHRFPASNSFNRCYCCGYEWIDVDELPSGSNE